MPDNTSIKSDALHQIEDAGAGNTMTLRLPKPNIQVAVLGLVAFITLFQTVQLVRIGAKASSTPVKAPAAATTTTGGSGSNTDVPQSMVGGC
ncbi:MAG: hypothetical protein M1366_01090 [Patescibacteria group bacterium]|nr:hypothetical protein [Patescibacteria group bacterium]